jgi:hypothetical protein
MNLPTSARHLPGVEVENERAEEDAHNQCRRCYSQPSS